MLGSSLKIASSYVKHSLGKSGLFELAVVPMFSDNYGYIIIDNDSKEVALVDPSDPPPVMKALKELNLTPTQLWCTHYHDDHQGGNAAFKKEFPSMHIYGPSLEPIKVIDSKMADGDLFEFGRNMKVKVIHVPCHTKGHIAFYGETNVGEEISILAAGDTLFTGGCGRFFEGTADQMLVNMNKFNQLPDRTVVCPAHEYTEANYKFLDSLDPEICGPVYAKVKAERAKGKFTVPTTIGAEKASNLFMKCNDERVQDLVSDRAGSNEARGDPVATMKLMRELKNSFK